MYIGEHVIMKALTLVYVSIVLRRLGLPVQNSQKVLDLSDATFLDTKIYLESLKILQLHTTNENEPKTSRFPYIGSRLGSNYFEM